MRAWYVGGLEVTVTRPPVVHDALPLAEDVDWPLPAGAVVRHRRLLGLPGPADHVLLVLGPAWGRDGGHIWRLAPHPSYWTDWVARNQPLPPIPVVLRRAPQIPREWIRARVCAADRHGRGSVFVVCAPCGARFLCARWGSLGYEPRYVEVMAGSPPVVTYPWGDAYASLFGPGPAEAARPGDSPCVRGTSAGPARP